MKIILIRHGKTQGNTEKRYIGSTDQELCVRGIEELKNIKHEKCDILISSPMKRCIQTTEIIYPNQKILIENDLRECDFGDFENKSSSELSDNEYYRKWIESNGTLSFPNGELPSDFKDRCCCAFEKIISAYRDADSIAFVVHGGTIMSVMERFALPKKGFYDRCCENGHGFACMSESGNLYVMERI